MTDLPPMLHMAMTMAKTQPFAYRGLSSRITDALIAAGIDAPERLLFLTEAELKRIPGIGKVGHGEIMRYRDRFLKKSF